MAAILWVWGLDSSVLISPDEALNRFAAAVIGKEGRPFLKLPVADPEDLLHPRHWVSVGDHAIPSYAPVAIYCYGLLLRMRTLGLLLVPALPASAAAAFVLGTAKLLPEGRKWLSVLAPILGFPALYWLMRPWINISALLICVCWSFYFWASWRKSGNSRQLAYAIFGVGAAAAVRPDYAAYLLVVALLFGVAASPAEWRRITVLVFAAGASAVALNLLLNRLVTGHAMLAAYQIVAAKDEGPSGSGGALGLLRQLLVPMGVPTFANARHFLAKYWLEMGFAAGLAAAQLAIVPLLIKERWQARALYVLGLLVMLCFMLSHMDPELAGAADRASSVHHSMPRYWSPVYLLAALPPLLLLGQCKNRVALALGTVLLFALAGSNGWDLYKREASSLIILRKFAERWTLATPWIVAKIPSDALVYTATYDKVLWSHFRIGIVADTEPTANSMKRAADANLSVFVFEPKFARGPRLALEAALKQRNLLLQAVDRRGIYRVTRVTRVAPSAQEQL